MRDDRYRDDRCFEDSRRREEKQRDDFKYKDEPLIRDGTNDNSDPKQFRDEFEVEKFCYRRSTHHDGSLNLDDRSTRYKGDIGKRRAGDKEDYDDIDIEKKYISAKLELVGNRERYWFRDADMVFSPNHDRHGNFRSYRYIY